MLELTLMMIIGTVLFFILRIIFKSCDELNIMSLLLGVLSLALVLQDTEIEADRLIYFVIPLFYVILMSALATATNWGDKS